MSPSDQILAQTLLIVFANNLCIQIKAIIACLFNTVYSYILIIVLQGEV